MPHFQMMVIVVLMVITVTVCGVVFRVCLVILLVEVGRFDGLIVGESTGALGYTILVCFLSVIECFWHLLHS